MPLTAHQLAEVRAATRGRLGILAGSPGTGKTYALAQIIRAIRAARGAARIGVAAPTGKAAVRATESLAAQGIDLMASTIHRLLGVAQVDGEDTREVGWRFAHDHDNPLPLDFLFVDEASMLDASLAASLFAAVPAGCHVLLVGDPNQLAPVGHGAPLRDLIAAGVPCGRLKEIQRNAGRIVRSCAEIRDHHRIRFSSELRLTGAEPENLLLVERSQPERQIAELEAFYGDGELFNCMVAEAGLDCSVDLIQDVQVVVPVNDKSPLARKALNRRLQGLLNPDGRRMDGCPFRVGDKIVCTKNQYDMPLLAGESNGAAAPGQCIVANGEQARVAELASGYIVATLTLPDRTIRIPRGPDNGNGKSNGEATTAAGCHFDLAYAISVHKSQGSEWPIVVVMLDGYSGARRVMTREWIYTAISRAKQCCVCIGPRNVADAACRRSGLWHRKTFLREQIEAKRLALLAEAWSEDLSDETESVPITA